MDDMMISYAQNCEDVVINRFFEGKPIGFYIDVGAQHPTADSVTKYFYDKGWSGINIEPQKKFFAMLSKERIRDVNLNIALSDHSGEKKIFEFPAISGYSGWSTLDATTARALTQQHGIEPVIVDMEVRTLADVCEEHRVERYDFLKIDVEGHERSVISEACLQKYRPQLIIVENTRPEEWEVLLIERDYTYAFYDGLNRYYVAQEHVERLPNLQAPANPADNYKLKRMLDLEQEIDRLRKELDSTRRHLCIVSHKYTLETNREGDGKRLLTMDGQPISIRPDAMTVILDEAFITETHAHFAGWSADVERGTPAMAIVLFANGMFLHASPLPLERPDLVELHGYETLRQSGFAFDVPIEQLVNRANTQVRIFAVATSGVASEASYSENYPFFDLSGPAPIKTDG